MTTVFMGVVAALAIFAIVAKTCAGKPKKAEVEKGEVIKQLLALADRESSISANRPPRSKDLRHASTSATHNDTSRREAPSPMSPARPIPLRRNLTDAETEEQIKLRYKVYRAEPSGERRLRNGTVPRAAVAERLRSLAGTDPKPESLRLVIVFRSPGGVVESGLPMRPERKRG
jgi:hypothetical protein